LRRYTKDLKFSDNSVITIPANMRTTMREDMWAQYVQSVEAQVDDDGVVLVDDDGVEVKDLMSKEHFMQLSKLATSGMQKSLAGLDNVSQRYGADNFKKMEVTCQKMIDLSRELAPYSVLIERMRDYSQFLKNDYPGRAVQVASIETRVESAPGFSP
jgi:hypothetical protein